MTIRRAVLLAVALLATGCASWFLKGAEMADGPPANPSATYTIAACATPDGQVIQAPALRYYLAQEQGGQALYEIEPDGDGARITNGWVDQAGTHYFVWVANSSAWQYDFPNDTSQQPTRLIFTQGTYGLDDSSGSTRPVGAPAAACVLSPAS